MGVALIIVGIAICVAVQIGTFHMRRHPSFKGETRILAVFVLPVSLLALALVVIGAVMLGTFTSPLEGGN